MVTIRDDGSIETKPGWQIMLELAKSIVQMRDEGRAADDPAVDAAIRYLCVQCRVRRSDELPIGSTEWAPNGVQTDVVLAITEIGVRLETWPSPIVSFLIGQVGIYGLQAVLRPMGHDCFGRMMVLPNGQRSMTVGVGPAFIIEAMRRVPDFEKKVLEGGSGVILAVPKGAVLGATEPGSNPASKPSGGREGFND